jgi:hypothetical protein
MKTFALTLTCKNKTSNPYRGFIQPPLHLRGGNPTSVGGFSFVNFAHVGAIQFKEVALAKWGLNFTLPFQNRISIFISKGKNSMKNKFSIAMSLAVMVAMLFTSLALADNVQNDVVVIDGDKIVTITAGAAGATVNYQIAATNGDGINGCNAADGSSATVTPQGMPSGVSVAPNSLSFSLCKDGSVNNAQGVLFTALSSTTPGDYPIIVSVFDNGGGNYNTSPASFTLRVLSGAVVKTTPEITWAAPADIVYGAALSGTQLNATTSVAGSFVYNPLAGTILNAGAGQTLHVDFFPTDTTNYNNASKDVTINVLKADAGCSISGYTGTYDGSAHGASGSCTGGGTLDLGAEFTNVPGGTAHWTFTGDSNHNDAEGDVAIVINKADASITVNGYTGTYDAAAHGATGSATGVGGVDLSAGLNLGASFINVPGGTAHWTFSGGTNYNDQSGDVSISITKADATCTISGYTANYDGNYHGASGSCSGMDGEDAGSLDLGASFKDFPGGTAHWVFTGNGNYNDQSGDVAIVFNSWWTLPGFFQPVDMGGVLNTVKNGSTVPLKFKIFAGSTELTDPASVTSLKYAKFTCTSGVPEDAIETTATGGTTLRYDSVAAQFVYNWKAPTTIGCYKVTLTTDDGSTLTANFKLK